MFLLFLRIIFSLILNDRIVFCRRMVKSNHSICQLFYMDIYPRVISLIHYKDRDKFPFYPNNTPKSLSKATKNTICMVLTYNDYLCNILILTYAKTKESFAQDELVLVFKEIIRIAFYCLQDQKYIYKSTPQNTSFHTKNRISRHPQNSIIINKLQNRKEKGLNWTSKGRQ